ncbi:S26 family signal peptidase [bacterium]|nr:S26 family signal peptidase [bacterium]MBU1613762.1 S26 family signal peptidase [bacterium]
MKKDDIDLLLFKECLDKNGRIILYPRGPSMAPFINTKERIGVEKTKPEEIKRGDIVLFHPENNIQQIRVHRVIKVYKRGEEYSFLIKGDSCLMEDGFIPEGRIIGKVILVVKGKKKLRFNTRWMKLVNYLLSRYSFITWYGYRYVIKGILMKVKLPLIKNLLFKIFWISMIDIPKFFIGILLTLAKTFSKGIVEADKCVS